MHTQFLCTFTKKYTLAGTLPKIQETYKIVYRRIFVLENVDDSNELFCTYNVAGTLEDKDTLSNTISVHRKRETNTIYTINALNELIKSINGILDKSFVVDWEPYKNSLILADSSGLRIIKTKIYDIVEI